MEDGCGNNECDTDVFAAKLPNGRVHVVWFCLDYPPGTRLETTT